MSDIAWVSTVVYNSCMLKANTLQSPVGNLDSRILALHTQGLSLRKIAMEVNLSHGAVDKRLKRILIEGPSADRDRETDKVIKNVIVNIPKVERGKGSVKQILESIPKLRNVEDMTHNELAAFWNESWNILLEAAIADLDLKLLDVLLTKFRSSLIKETAPVIHIQPVEFSVIPVPVPLSDIARGMADGITQLIKGNHLSFDDAQQVYNALSKYYPLAEPVD